MAEDASDLNVEYPDQFSKCQSCICNFLDGVNALGVSHVTSAVVQNINDTLGSVVTDSGALFGVIGSRLWPPQAYKIMLRG